MKKLTLAVLATAALLTANTYAMQVNIKPANDIVANQDKLNISFVIYYAAKALPNNLDIKDQTLILEGIAFDKIPTINNSINSILANLNPIDSVDGSHSHFTLGYEKPDGTVVTPASCQNMRAKPAMSIEINETGCVVS
ncbi:MAG TPA: hypothetical protein VL360_00180 [Gammaproteobacteria bacterium]|nr:hypothetical protein [Gammaproteobacteria bacterium]